MWGPCPPPPCADRTHLGKLRTDGERRSGGRRPGERAGARPRADAPAARRLPAPANRARAARRSGARRRGGRGRRRGRWRLRLRRRGGGEPARRCRGAGATCCPTIAWSPSTAPRRATSSARSAVGTPDEAGERLLDQADAYSGGKRPVLPVLELIVYGRGGRSGRGRRVRPAAESDAVIRRYLAEVRRLRGLLLLDIQPGRADFRDEVERLEPYLREPDVGLALDPEWHVGPTEVPGPGDRLGRRRDGERDLRRTSPRPCSSSTCPRSCS